MVRPDISVVIPTKNRHGFLRQAVESVLAQRLLPHEILVADDGQGAATAVSGLWPGVRVLDNQARGPVAARQLAVDQARGDLIAFLDDDDWLIDHSYLQQATEAIAQGADLVFCDGTMRFEDGGQDETFAFDANAKSLETNNTILISGVVYRKAIHAGLGGFDASLPYYWDWDWYLRVARAGYQLRRKAGLAVAIRVHGQNMSGQQQERDRRENLDRLSAKHGLAHIPLKNHLSLSREGQRR
jgi:glycosyltransferase involved in cell wall biosynthesis